VLAQGPRQEPRQVSLETKPEDFYPENLHDGTSTQRLTEILAPLTMTMLGGSFQLRKEQAREGRWRKDLLATARTAKGMNSSVPRGGAAQAGKGRPDIRLA
jgi:hypothetical protein